MSENSTEQQRNDPASEPHGEDEQSTQQESEESTEHDESHDESSRVDWKTAARRWEKQAKQNKEAASRLAELEKSQMTEQQRLERERDEAKSSLESTTVQLARLRAAMKHRLVEDLDDDDALDEVLDLLGTGTQEEIDTRAKRIAELRGSGGTKKPASRRPAESLRGGVEPEQEPEETDVRKLAARMFQH
jgi:hypothetical protein